jgi:hypothetical protein
MTYSKQGAALDEAPTRVRAPTLSVRSPVSGSAPDAKLSQRAHISRRSQHRKKM